MIKWFKALSKQEKLMATLIVVLLIGIILRWENVRDKALVWFKLEEIVEERADSLPQDSLVKPLTQPADTVAITDTLVVSEVAVSGK